MARQSPISLIDPKKTHLTKAHIEQREKQENALKSSGRMRPSEAVKNDKIAYDTFKRLKKIFASVEMDDAFYESGLNRYCLMQSDHERMRKELEQIAQADIDIVERMMLERRKETSIAKLRDQMLSWERENLSTVLAKLRAVPKQVQDKDEELSGVAAFMRGRA